MSRSRDFMRSIAVLLCALASTGCAGAVALGGVSALGGAAVFLAPDSSAVPDEGPYFWHGTNVGTDAYAGPFDVLLNKGFATAQWPQSDRHIFDYPYGWSPTFRAITHLDESFGNSGGFWNVFGNEVFPTSETEWKKWAWAPNYYGHLIEGGIAARRLAEWYEGHDVPHPALMAGLTTWAAAFINEAYENPMPGVIYAGVPMDLLFFDVGGILLFNSDGVSRFFAQRLGAGIWPTQASIMLSDARLWNNSHHLVLKVPLGFTDRFAMFLKSGIGFQAGLTYHAADALDVSVGFGQESKKRYIHPETLLETAEFGWGGGLWIDRGGSLLASLLIDPNTQRTVALNVFPGVVPKLRSLGLWLTFNAHGQPAFGFAGRQTLGVGAGFGY
jgi:hypothetical protein